MLRTEINNWLKYTDINSEHRNQINFFQIGILRSPENRILK